MAEIRRNQVPPSDDCRYLTGLLNRVFVFLLRTQKLLCLAGCWSVGRHEPRYTHRARRKHKHVVSSLEKSLSCSTMVSFCPETCHCCRFALSVSVWDSWSFSCCNKQIPPAGFSNLISSCSSKRRYYAFLLVCFSSCSEGLEFMKTFNLPQEL